MTAHRTTVEWKRDGQAFIDKAYSRAHVWTFDGGAVVRGSSAPESVPVPMSDVTAVDPEEAMVASLSSCHMLWFLAFAAGDGLVVDRYLDEASGTLGRDEKGRRYMDKVTLRPVTTFFGVGPTQGELDALHHSAHEHCEMARSVRAEIVVEANIG